MDDASVQIDRGNAPRPDIPLLTTAPETIGPALDEGAIGFSAPSVADGTMTFRVRHWDREDDIHFTVPADFHAHPDCLAAALATLCGTKYQNIHFAFPMSERMRAAISHWTRAAIHPRGDCPPRKSGKRVGLNFSGGFDSLAAYYLAPEEQVRCAIDFGGWFLRERQFFETLKPDVICATDLRSKQYDRQSWMFMGAVSLLYADYLDLEAIGYGTNFESSPWHFHTAPATAPKGPNNALIKGLDLYDSTVIRGLTGFGVSKVVLHYAGDLIPESLKSLAAEGTVKRVRKTAVLEAVRHAAGGPPPSFDDYRYPSKRYKLGDNYIEDFLALLLARTYGKAIVSRWMEGLERIDDGELAAVDVAWSSKFNPIFEAYIPASLRPKVMARLAAAGIGGFTEEDWRHYRAYRRILEQVHKFPVP